MSKLGLSADEVLTTTRSVRKRLDFDRPVSREIITECIEIAHQSPSGSNSMRWRWLIIDDQERKDFLAALYRERFYAEQAGSAVQESGAYLADNMARVPALVIPLLADRMTDATPVSRQASRWGSILPGVWSFMLALRERGLGSCWTTLHLADEKLVAERLNIPYDQFTQAGLFPVAYTIGTDFKLAKRPPAETFIRWNEWS
jgi:nitroreductase